jgi:hypothetical protein
MSIKVLKVCKKILHSLIDYYNLIGIKIVSYDRLYILKTKN